jgi:hypothetical protein
VICFREIALSVEVDVPHMEAALDYQNQLASREKSDKISVILGCDSANEILFEVESNEAANALQAIQTLIDTNFGEKQP